MLRHQKIYCASLCAAFCWPYGKESRRQAKMTLVEVRGERSGDVWPASLVAPPLSYRKRAVYFGEEGGNRRHHGSRTYSKYRREHILIVRLRASRMIHSKYAS